MANVTKNLSLTLPDPATDGDEAFNIDTWLNWNFTKLDAAFGDLSSAALKLGLTNTNLAGILDELADRILAIEEGNT